MLGATTRKRHHDDIGGHGGVGGVVHVCGTLARHIYPPGPGRCVQYELTMRVAHCMLGRGRGRSMNFTFGLFLPL